MSLTRNENSWKKFLGKFKSNLKLPRSDGTKNVKKVNQWENYSGNLLKNAQNRPT